MSRYLTVGWQRILADVLPLGDEPRETFVVNVKPVNADGTTLIDAVSGGLKVAIVSGGSGGGGTGGLTNTELRASAVPVSTAALPLPAGASTSAGVASMASTLDADLLAIWSRLGNGSTHVVIDSMPAGGSGLTDTELRASAVPMSAAALPLPTGAATGAKQDTGNASIASVDGKFPALVGGRIPVVLPAGGSGLTDTELRATAVPVSIAASVAVTGTFWQATQPISAATLPLPAGAATEATLALIKAKTDNLDVLLSTRAVTGLTDAQLRASAVPVSGTFYQATQPVSIAASVAVTGTFWQATQPVSLAAAVDVSDRAGRALGVVVQGAAGAAAWKVDGSAVTQPVSGTFWQATQPVSAASLPLPTGAATETTLAAMSAKLPATLGQKAMAAAMAVSLASDQSAIPVTAPTITKGTQGANGFTTQDLKDAGRARVSIVFQGVGAIADALLSLVKITNGVAAAGATTIPVAANKRLRITSMTFSVKANVAAAAFATFTVRVNPTGAAVLASPSELRVDVGNTEAVIGAARAINVPIPDGMEFAGTEQIAVSALAQATTNILSVSLSGFEY